MGEKSLLSKKFSQNNVIIESLINLNFGLTADSFSKFKEYLHNPFLRKIPEFKDIYEAKDLRFRIDLTPKLLETFDENWVRFKKEFKWFCKKNKVTYKNFSTHRVVINKNVLKLKKAILDFYMNEKNVIYLLRDFTDFSLKKRILKDKTLLFLIRKGRMSPIYYRDSEKGRWGMLVKSEETIKKYLEDGAIKYCNSINLILKSKLDRFLYNTENRKMPKIEGRNLQIVFSANYADWLLCSTAESWTSCLNLTSKYSYCYWAGMPGIITDKNRILAYITDRSKKTYRGIESEKMIARNWISLITINRKKSLLINRGYPNEYFGLMAATMKQWNHNKLKIVDPEILSQDTIRFETYHPIPFIWHYVYIGENIRGLPKSFLVDTTIFIDNGMKYAIDENNYSIQNNFDRRTTYYWKEFENQQAEIKELLDGRFEFCEGLSYLDRIGGEITRYYKV